MTVAAFMTVASFSTVEISGKGASGFLNNPMPATGAHRGAQHSNFLSRRRRGEGQCEQDNPNDMTHVKLPSEYAFLVT